ncbi:CapA family protein [Paeniglutamicibacter cryotolerans]
MRVSETPASAGGAPAAPDASTAPGKPTAAKAPKATTTAAPPLGSLDDCGADDCLDLVVTGDVLLHPALWEQAIADGSTAAPDYFPLVSGIKPLLDEAEVAICNLETPVAASPGPYSGYPGFNVPPQILPALKQVGYDGCTTASNHTIDAGTAGVVRTLDALDDAGLVHTGSYRTRAESLKPLLIESRGAEIALIAGAYGLNGQVADMPWRVDGIGKAGLIARAKAARAAGADLVVAGLHAGVEYTDRASADQIALNRALAESGAFDFIYSHHTHSVLPLEKHAGTWIVYGLGNSVAKHATNNPLNREGLSVKMRFERSGKSWKPAAPQWAGHIMAENPSRWCALPAPARKPCTNAAVDAASLKRTAGTVNAMGAAKDGATPWIPAGR